MMIGLRWDSQVDPICQSSILMLECKIVGVRYYLSDVVMSESLALSRDPENEHDGNAIRVDNSRGIQVGQYYCLAYLVNDPVFPAFGLPF
jgi:hypothetical protein